MKLKLTPEVYGIGDACANRETMMASLLDLRRGVMMARKHAKIVSFYRRMKFLLKIQSQ